MVFDGRFRDHILPDQLHILNVSFTAPRLRVEFGGCAGNIAHNFALLEGHARPMGAVGNDFGDYRGSLKRRGVDCQDILELDDKHTARAFIVTDLDNNQITAFHPGAMEHCHRCQAPADDGVEIGIIAPESRAGMIAHARQLREARIPFMFDPGQGVPMFSGDELRGMIADADWLVCNDYEARLIMDRTGLDRRALAAETRALIITRGAEGSAIYAGDQTFEIPAVPVEARDPTGCGDAYRAGLIYGILRGLDWNASGRVAALLGAINAEHEGAQNHRFTMDDFRARYRRAFGAAL